MRERNDNSLIKFLISLITLALAIYKLYEVLQKLGAIAQAKKWAAEQKWYGQAKDYYRNARNYLNEEDFFDFDETSEEPVEVAVEVPLERLPKLAGRSKQVLKFIQKEGGVTMTRMQKRFKTVTPRTLRRDLDKLEKLGYIRQSGRTKNSFYELA